MLLIRKYLIYIFIILFLFSINQVRSDDTSHLNTHVQRNNEFTENKGQYPDSIKFYSLNSGLNIWICDKYLLLDYYIYSDDERVGEVVRLDFNWNRYPEFLIDNISKSKKNFFFGREKNKWIKNSHSFNSIKIYDDIGNELIISINKNSFFCEIKSKNPIEKFCSCNSDYNLEEGTNQLIYSNGLLKNVIESNPKSQILQNYSSLIYSSFLGGNGWDSGQDMVIDKNGNIYIVGYTNSDNFPTTLGAYSEKLRNNKHGEPDVFISKFDSTGANLVFSTYIGSQMEDFGKSIGIDDSLNIYITGHTGPTETFPITANAFDSTQNGAFDAFLLKLNRNGDSLIYSTYIGSSNDDFGQSLAVDSKGIAHITGYTMYNSDFPITNQSIQDLHSGKNDAFYSRMNSNGDSLLVSTLLGGEDDDFGEMILLGKNGLLYIVGSTRSEMFPVTTNGYDKSYNDTTTSSSRSDAFLTILHNSGLYISYSTFLGGSGRDVAYSIGLDKENSIYLTGITESKDFPVTSYAFDTTYRSLEGERTAGDIFVTKLNAAGSEIIYSTYIGGSSADKAYDIKIAEDYYTFIIGSTSSFDIPFSKNAFDKTYNDSTFGADVLIVALDWSGHNLVYSSYFGGIAHEISYAMQLMKGETLYFVGTTSSKDFPTTQSPFSSTYNNDNQSDIFFSVLTPKLLAVDAGGDKNGILHVCKGDLIQIGNLAIGTRGSTSYTWYPETGLNRTDIAKPLLTVSSAATYIVYVKDEKGNEDWDTIHIELLPFIKAEIYGPQFVFKNSRHTYGTIKNDFAKYKWFAEGGVILSEDTSYSISVKWGKGDYGYLTLVTQNDLGCSDTLKSFMINIGDLFVPKIIPLGKTTFCDGEFCILDAGEGFKEYLWSDGKISRFDTIRLSGDYWVFLKDTLGYQAISDTIKVIVLPSPEKPLISFNGNMLSCNIITGYYQWYHDGSKILGANQRTFKPVMIGLYKCEIGWNSNYCTSFSDTLRLNFDNAVQERMNIQFEIFPNPADEKLLIKIIYLPFFNLDIQIVDLTGRLIFENQYKNLENQSVIQIPLTNIQTGIYNIYIKTGHQISARKLIIYH